MAASGNAGKESTKAVSANHFDIPSVPSSFGPVSFHNDSAVPASESGLVKAPQLGSDLSARDGTKGATQARASGSDRSAQDGTEGATQARASAQIGAHRTAQDGAT